MKKLQKPRSVADCLSETEIRDLLDGRLEPGVAEIFYDHLTMCSICANKREELPGEDPLTNEMGLGILSEAEDGFFGC